ncbi:MAG: response regulator [Alphaproteobacteria bacterium]
MPRRQPHRIAIVDDDEAVLKALCRVLNAWGFASETYATAREFLESSRIRKPSCLILDLKLPGMTGLELLRHLARSGRSIPTIVITGHEAADAFEGCLAAGAKACLRKPIDDRELVGAITKAIGETN